MSFFFSPSWRLGEHLNCSSKKEEGFSFIIHKDKSSACYSSGSCSKASESALTNYFLFTALYTEMSL